MAQLHSKLARYMLLGETKDLRKLVSTNGINDNINILAKAIHYNVQVRECRNNEVGNMILLIIINGLSTSPSCK